MGMDAALNKAYLLAPLVVAEVSIKRMYTLRKVSHWNCSIAEATADKRSPAVGKAVRDLVLPASSVLIAITRHNTVLISCGDTLIESDDAILLLADAAAKETMSRLFVTVTRARHQGQSSSKPGGLYPSGLLLDTTWRRPLLLAAFHFLRSAVMPCASQTSTNTSP